VSRIYTAGQPVDGGGPPGMLREIQCSRPAGERSEKVV